MNLREAISLNSNEFVALCKSHDVLTLYSFGSALSSKFDPVKSDIDLLVNLSTQDPIQRGEHLLDLWDKFEKMFQFEVDLLTDDSIKNPILRASIDRSKVLIYDGKEHKVSI